MLMCSAGSKTRGLMGTTNCLVIEMAYHASLLKDSSEACDVYNFFLVCLHKDVPGSRRLSTYGLTFGLLAD